MMNPLLSRIVPLVLFAAGILLLRKPGLSGKRFLGVGLLLIAANGALWGFFRELAYESRMTDLVVWSYYIGPMCLLVGAYRVQPGTSTVATAAATVASIINRYFSTDELVARTAALPPVNDEIENVKLKWHDALQRFVNESPESTKLIDDGKYGRRLLLQRSVSMGVFESFSCNQLRSIEVSIAGPGDSRGWMTVAVQCSADHTPVGAFTIDNHKVMKHLEDLAGVGEFRRIDRFLRTGKVKQDFPERLEQFVRGIGSFLLLPVHTAVLVLGMFASILRHLFRGRKIVTRFVAAHRPPTLPPEEAGVPVGYWYVLLENQADKIEELLTKVKEGLGERESFGAETYEKDVIQWGGFRLKEVRLQTVVEFRRCKIYLGIYPYGKDLYLRWSSHINRNTWSLEKFAYNLCTGFRFKKDLFSWAKPLFQEVPSVFEYAPTVSPTTDYDWADLDAVEGLVHEVVTREVRKLKERHQIEQEINYEIKKGLMGEASATASESRRAGSSQRSPLAWARGFTRKK